MFLPVGLVTECVTNSFDCFAPVMTLNAENDKAYFQKNSNEVNRLCKCLGQRKTDSN